MEHLFAWYNQFSKQQADPFESSLFNVTTMKQLVSLGNDAPNILGADQGLVYGTDFELPSGW